MSKNNTGNKEHPLLMNGSMVRATRAGAKSQTRRVVKPDPGPYWNPTVGHYNPLVTDNGGYEVPGPEIFGASDETAGRKCPYGQPGDRIWVRETFYAYGRWVTRYSEKKGRDEWHFIDVTLECDRAYQYEADRPDVPLATGRGGALPGWYKRPAIFMPRAACRILLKVAGVRVERLQDITDADIEAEGIDTDALLAAQDSYDIVAKDGNATGRPTLRSAWRDLWESINGAESWDANPWCWCVEFRRVKS